MKKIFKLLIVFLLLVQLSNAQTEAQQKAQQEWIYANRSSYISQPFSLLYNALTIKPQSVWGGIGHANRFVEPKHKFFYRDTANYDDTVYYFYIEWQTPPLLTETTKYQNFGFRAFNAQEYLTYKDLIIKKLDVYRKVGEPW